MGYDFTKFSPQSFERFAQALAAKALGPGVQIYGAGPDGGREASYNGRLEISTHGAQWDGYIVAQAKHRAIPKGGADDAAWLERELTADLDKFLDPSRGLQKPEYYLAITNVTLTSVHGTSAKGGQQKIEELFQGYQAPLGLRGWLVWHADTLSAMLDDYEGIRTRYAAWVTEGDVLSAALRRLQRPSILSVVPLALKRDLRKDRDVRRKDAGQITEKRIFLEDVFVDLPLERVGKFFGVVSQIDEDAASRLDNDEVEGSSDDSDESEASSDEELGVVASLLARSADKLDAESLLAAPGSKRRRFRPTKNRIVLLGGPGQGKSTAGQFLAQIARARITIASLRARPSDEVSEAAEIILSRARAENLDIEAPARFPLHIELPKFADALKQSSDRQERLSLLRYASQNLAKGSDSELQPTDLRDWLGAYPWILILDGLDEVPPTGNRADVILAINEFWDDVNEVNGDVMVVVTTRPQGYGDDLPRRHWEHWTMASLSPKHAMKFAGRLSEVLLSDGARRDEILGELRRASEDAATAPIMISPLQVSILFTLVETRGGVPADRWSLFQRHYNLLRDREAAKEGATAKLLREYASQIDQIHYDAGFLLHVRAESAGSADAYIDEQELRSLIISLLKAEGYDDETISGVTRELVRIATDRLVLLGSKIGGRISFDVRSLQEFMAAARIMSSPEQSIQDRLREISGKTHWRHVLRIAASKAFALTELSHFRKNIIHVCDALDKGDLGHADQTAQSGARFALDLLIDNVAARLPEMRRALASRALEILRSGPRAVVPQLGQFLDQDTKQIYETSIVNALSNPDSLSFSAAMKLLILVINSKPQFRTWAEQLLIEAWPTEPKQALSIVRELGVTSDASAFIDKFNSSLLEVGVTDCLEYVESLFPIGDEDEESLPFPALRLVRLFSEDGERQSLVIPIKTSHGELVGHMSFRPLFAEQAIEFDLPKTSDWQSLAPICEFMRSPTKEHLAKVFRTNDNLEIYRTLFLPWPMKLLLDDCTDYSKLSAQIEEGAIGDTDDWRRAEERWLSSGVTEYDLRRWVEGDYREIATIGSPPPSVDRYRFKEEQAEKLSALFSTLLEQTLLPNKKRKLLQLLFPSIDVLKSKLASKIVDQQIAGLSDGLLSDRRFLMAVRNLPFDNPEFLSALQTVNRIGQTRGAELLGFAFPSKVAIDLLSRNPSLRGFLPFVLPMRSNRGRGQYTALQKVPAEFFEYVPSDNSASKTLVFILRTAKGMEDQISVEDLIEKILSEVPKNRWIYVLEFISNSPFFADDKAIRLLDLFCERMRRQDTTRFSRLQAMLKSKLDSRRSRLNETSVCNLLSLPSQSLALSVRTDDHGIQ